MSSIRNITSSTPVPHDLAKKIGVGGVNEILDVFWKGYQELKHDASFVVNASSEEDDITQRWYEKILSIWDSRNRTTSIALNGLCPIHQYADNTMKKRKGSKSPTIDFYGNETEQFSFYRIPKMLFKEKMFKDVSAEAKVLYGLMLDRTGLSAKNGWLDEENRVYIVYTIAEIMEDLNCADQKAGKLLSELDTVKGIENPWRRIIWYDLR